MTTVAGVLAFAVAFGGAAEVWAQTPSASLFQLLDGDTILTEDDRDTYFNRAHCTCSTQLTVQVSVTVPASTSGTFKLVYGKSCIDSDGDLNSSCPDFYSDDIESLPTRIEETLSVSDLAGGCDSKDENRAIYAVFNSDDEGEWTQVANLGYSVDTDPPPSPKATRVEAGEELAEVAFEAPSSTSDVAKYQVLCRTATTSEGLKSPPSAAFDTALDRCNQDLGQPRTEFVCSSAQDGTDSITVQGLENGREYIFEVISVDEARNPSAPVEVGRVTPAPEEDFWERYKASGGQADGEHCFVATAAYGDYDHPTVRILRHFRDRVLKSSAVGRAAIDVYYTHSPPLAEWIARHEVARMFARLVLWPLVIAASFLLSVGITGALALLAIALAFLFRRWRGSWR